MPCTLLHTDSSCWPLRHSPLPRELQGWLPNWPPRFQLATEFTTAGAGMRVSEGLGERVCEGEAVGDTVLVTVGEPAMPRVGVPLIVGLKEPLREGVGEPLGEKVGVRDLVGEGLAPASLYSVPPSSATRISLSLDSEGEPRTGRGRGTDHCLPPVLLRDSRLPVALPTLVPTTSKLKQLK